MDWRSFVHFWCCRLVSDAIRLICSLSRTELKFIVHSVFIWMHFLSIKTMKNVFTFFPWRKEEWMAWSTMDTYLEICCKPSPTGPQRKSPTQWIRSHSKDHQPNQGTKANGLSSYGLPSNALPSNGPPSNGLPSNGPPSNKPPFNKLSIQCNGPLLNRQPSN